MLKMPEKNLDEATSLRGLWILIALISVLAAAIFIRPRLASEDLGSYDNEINSNSQVMANLDKEEAIFEKLLNEQCPQKNDDPLDRLPTESQPIQCLYYAQQLVELGSRSLKSSYMKSCLWRYREAVEPFHRAKTACVLETSSKLKGRL